MKVEMELGNVKKFGIGLWNVDPQRRPLFASPNLHDLFLYFQSPSTMITATNKM